MISRCVDVADVMTAVNFGRDHGLRIAIRGGGHNGPGLASVDDGLIIDLAAMRGVHIDPTARTARVAAGCAQGDVVLSPALRESGGVVASTFRCSLAQSDHTPCHDGRVSMGPAGRPPNMESSTQVRTIGPEGLDVELPQPRVGR
jgi:hypothetical protein